MPKQVQNKRKPLKIHKTQLNNAAQERLYFLNTFFQRYSLNISSHVSNREPQRSGIKDNACEMKRNKFQWATYVVPLQDSRLMSKLTWCLKRLITSNEMVRRNDTMIRTLAHYSSDR